MEKGKRVRPVLTEAQIAENIRRHAERVRFFREQDRRERELRAAKLRCLAIIHASHQKETP
jgi:hypothetical protein